MNIDLVAAMRASESRLALLPDVGSDGAFLLHWEAGEPLLPEAPPAERVELPLPDTQVADQALPAVTEHVALVADRAAVAVWRGVPAPLNPVEPALSLPEGHAEPSQNPELAETIGRSAPVSPDRAAPGLPDPGAQHDVPQHAGAKTGAVPPEWPADAIKTAVRVVTPGLPGPTPPNPGSWSFLPDTQSQPTDLTPARIGMAASGAFPSGHRANRDAPTGLPKEIRTPLVTKAETATPDRLPPDVTRSRPDHGSARGDGNLASHSPAASVVATPFTTAATPDRFSPGPELRSADILQRVAPGVRPPPAATGLRTQPPAPQRLAHLSPVPLSHDAENPHSVLPLLLPPQAVVAPGRHGNSPPATSLGPATLVADPVLMDSPRVADDSAKTRMTVQAPRVAKEALPALRHATVPQVSVDLRPPLLAQTVAAPGPDLPAYPAEIRQAIAYLTIPVQRTLVEAAPMQGQTDQQTASSVDAARITHKVVATGVMFQGAPMAIDPSETPALSGLPSKAESKGPAPHEISGAFEVDRRLPVPGPAMVSVRPPPPDAFPTAQPAGVWTFALARVADAHTHLSATRDQGNKIAASVQTDGKPDFAVVPVATQPVLPQDSAPGLQQPGEGPSGLDVNPAFRLESVAPGILAETSAVRHAPAEPRAPIPAPQQVAEAMRQMTGGRLELTLAPEELGRVTLNFQPDGDGVRVHLVADRPETLDLLRRHAPELTAELRAAGYETASFSFGRNGQNSVTTTDHGQEGAPAAAPDDSPSSRPPGATSGALDLRL